MTEILKEAIAQVGRLPEAAQDKIGEELLLHVDKLRRLRAKLERGLSSLDHDGGREVDIEELIWAARADHESA